MLLSFSIPEMLPAILLGAHQADYNQDMTPALVAAQSTLNKPLSQLRGVTPKRQTIRRYDFENPNLKSPYSRVKPGDMADLWWKSRTAERFKIGRAPINSVEYVKIYRSKQPARHGRAAGSVRLYTPNGHVYSHLDAGGNINEITALAQADGFPSAAEFWDYFAPNPSDTFKGVLIKW